LEGFLAIAPDALSPLGGTPEDPDKAPSLMQKLDSQSTMQNYVAAVRYLKTHPVSTGMVGAVGFCWGGGIANQVAVNSPDILAVVPYYGRQPAPEDVSKIKASLLLHYAGIDEGINKGIPAYEEALKKRSIDYKMYIYEGAQHAFNDDTNRNRYNKEAAQLAWQRTISFLKENLKKYRLVGSFAQAAFLVLSAAATRTRVVATRVGACLGTFGLRQRDFTFMRLPAPQGG
jgi:carboxymethylenebutenolidase